MSMTSFVSDEPDLFNLPKGVYNADEALIDITDEASDNDVDEEHHTFDKHNLNRVEKTGDSELDRIAEMEAEEIL